MYVLELGWIVAAVLFGEWKRLSVVLLEVKTEADVLLLFNKARKSRFPFGPLYIKLAVIT